MFAGNDNGVIERKALIRACFITHLEYSEVKNKFTCIVTICCVQRIYPLTYFDQDVLRLHISVEYSMAVFRKGTEQRQ